MILTPDVMTALSALPRARQAEALLSGPESPLPRDARFGLDVAALAYMAFLAYSHGRHKILKGRPGYEAVEMLGARLRSAATRAGSIDEWAHELLRSVGVQMTDLRMDDRLWWREVVALQGPARRLLQPNVLAEIGTASELLRDDWLYAIRDHAKTLTPEGGA